MLENKFDGFLTIGKTPEENKRLGLNARTPGRNVVPNIPSYVSEIGYGSLPDLEENEIEFLKKGNPITYPYLYHLRFNKEIKEKLIETGLIKLFKNASSFYKKQQEIHGIANKRMLEAIRSNDNVIGYCVHALTAGDWIIGAGLLDLWRNPKGLAYGLTKEGNLSKIAILRTNKRNYFKGENVKISTLIVNERQSEKNKVRISLNKLNKNKKELIYNSNNIYEIKNGINDIGKINLGNDLEPSEYELNVVLTKNNLIEYQTSIKFNVFPLPKHHQKLNVAVLKDDKRTVDFLNKYGIKYEIFSKNTDVNTTVIVNESDTDFYSSKDGNIVEKNNEDSLTDYSKLIDQINKFTFKGGNVIFLKIPGKTRKRIGPNLTFVADGIDYLPSKPIKNISQGLWDGILHINSKHPFFNKLPVNVNMSGIYENIAPTISLRNFKGKNIVQTIAFDRIPNGNILKRNYIGSGEVWSGSDLSIVKHGKGKMVLSTLKLLENLNYDPVSEIILFNMINYFK